MALINLIPGPQCKEAGLAIRDAIELLSGKWKVCILQNLTGGAMRFKDLQEAVAGISAKVLTRELQDLEMHQLITRTVQNTKPITVHYSLDTHAEQIWQVLQALLKFGVSHRTKIKQSLPTVTSS